ncbi:MAG: cyclic nucleotide-binding domain-containing protein [Thermodesulfovibrionales bacterium]|nr:cyclic nucleotide-binding domain-containing protein [Thermodesulfovibrionales bacterium]
MKEEIKVLFEKNKVFSDLEDAEKDLLSSLVLTTKYNADDIIYREGEEGDSLDIIVKGKVRICKMTVEGNYLHLSTVREGEMFGMMSFLDRGKHSATIIADEDTHLLVLKKGDFDRLLTTHPVIYGKVVRNIAIHLASLLRNMNMQYMDMMHMVFGKSK